VRLALFGATGFVGSRILIPCDGETALATAWFLDARGSSEPTLRFLRLFYAHRPAIHGPMTRRAETASLSRPCLRPAFAASMAVERVADPER
jgi:hypothetical protein